MKTGHCCPIKDQIGSILCRVRPVGTDVPPSQAIDSVGFLKDREAQDLQDCVDAHVQREAISNDRH